MNEAKFKSILKHIFYNEIDQEFRFIIFSHIFLRKVVDYTLFLTSINEIERKLKEKGIDILNYSVGLLPIEIQNLDASEDKEKQKEGISILCTFLNRKLNRKIAKKNFSKN